MSEWQKKDVWVDIWQTFFEILDSKSRLKWEEVFADGTIAPAKKGAPQSEKRSVGREQNYGVTDGKGLPTGIKLSSSTPQESKLIESTLDTIRIPRVGAGRPRTKIK